MRIHVSFIDRVGITQEVLALLGGRNLNLDAVEMVPPNVYIDAPTLSAEVLEELRDALFSVRGVQAVTVVDILPGQRQHLQLDALLAAMTDPVLALDSAGKILLANPALIALYGREPAGESINELFDDPTLLATLLEHGFRLALREISVNGQTLLLDATPITDAGALLTLYQPNRIGEQLSALHHDHAEGFDALLGESPAIRTLKARAQRVAALDAPLLIQGETGTGKELIARHAHEFSGRKGAFVGVNCGALPAELVEAELFGYVAGAFTGARRDGSPGLIASAHGGTLLLDEIAELPLPLQASLLRFLDDRCVRPVGGTTSRVVDVQLLAASHADLAREVAARRFRQDLLYRLNVVEVRLPPLRQRTDLAAAVHFVLAELDPAATLSPAALERLCGYGWPGNFRELRSLLTRLLLQATPTGEAAQLGLEDVAAVLPPGADGASPSAAPAASSLQRAATLTIVQAFDRCGRSVSRTSRTLGISRTTVYRHLREAGRAPQRTDI